MKGALTMFGNLESDMKKVLLAGIGALATTVEKSKEMVEELVKKGEITVEQGKALNEELKHDAQVQKEEKESAVCAEDVSEKLERLSAEDLAKIKAKLAELEKKEDNYDCQ